MAAENSKAEQLRSPGSALDARRPVVRDLPARRPGRGLDVARLPYSLKVLLENLLRHEDDVTVRADDIEALAGWDPDAEPDREIAFAPARILMQDFTGVPAVVDLAAMRDAMAAMGGDPARVNPLIPAELVIDHSIVADVYGVPDAFVQNAELEFERNRERYQFLRWGQEAFDNFRVVPPNTGICHQVNLEYLARVVFADDEAGQAYPDTLLGTDSHTTMVNGLGVLGWGVGGIEAEAAMLGQPVSMLIPRVVGFQLTGALPEGTHGHRPGPHRHRAAAQARRGRQVRRVLRRRRGRRSRWPTGPRSATCRPSTARPAPSSRSTTRRCATWSSPAGRPSRSPWSRPTPRSRACGTTPATSRTTPSGSSSTCPRSGPAWPARPGPRTGCPSTGPRPCSGPAWPASSPRRPSGRAARRPSTATSTTAPAVPTTAALPNGVRNGTPDEASAESFPASDPPAYAAAGGAAGRAAAAPSGDRGGGPGGRRATATARSCRSPWPTAPSFELDHGHVVIAAITSCTNTSNPSVMIGGRAAGQERGRAGPHDQAVGQDLPGARVQGGHGLLRAGRADALPGEAGLQPGRLRLHHLHRQQRAAAARDHRGRRPTATWPWPPSCPATATSRAASTRTCA